MSQQSSSSLGDSLLGSPSSFPRSSSQFRQYIIAAARLVLCERFIYEFYDKIARFNFWSNSVAGNGFGDAASYLIAFIIVLLLIGVPCVVAAPLLPPDSRWRRRLIWCGLICLVVFQLPTTIMFESGAYEISSSVSIIGGLLLATCSSV
jgi:hypothetical protein